MSCFSSLRLLLNCTANTCNSGLQRTIDGEFDDYKTGAPSQLGLLSQASTSGKTHAEIIPMSFHLSLQLEQSFSTTPKDSTSLFYLETPLMLGKWALRRVSRGPRPGIISTRKPQHARDTRVSHPQIPSKHLHSSTRRAGITHNVQLHVHRLPRARGLATAAIPNVLVPPLIFVGLLLSLWIWKCFWIVVMQDKLLYLSWLPPLTRSEKIADYERDCRPVEWTEKRIRSLDGTKLAVCEGQIPLGDKATSQKETHSKPKKSVVICYFQGNGGSTPMRLPLLSQFLRTITETSKSHSSAVPNQEDVEYTILALSYRGYWTSSGRATQSGIETDAQAFLNWVSANYGKPNTETQVILWGHSLGAAVAAAATATYLPRRHAQQKHLDKARGGNPLLPIAGLIMEAPTSSIKDMLISLYPQRWLPYRYLWPLSWNSWDIKISMDQLARWRDEIEAGALGTHSRSLPPIFLLSAEKDEVIPEYVPEQLETHAKSLNLEVARKDVPGAMHIEAPLKLDGRTALVDFILKNTSSTRSQKNA